MFRLLLAGEARTTVTGRKPTSFPGCGGFVISLPAECIQSE